MDYSFRPPTVEEFAALRASTGWGPVSDDQLAMLVGAARAAGIASVHLFAAAGRAPFYERNGFAVRPQDAPGMDLAR